jgi:hypothetical protein
MIPEGARCCRLGQCSVAPQEVSVAGVDLPSWVSASVEVEVRVVHDLSLDRRGLRTGTAEVGHEWAVRRTVEVPGVLGDLFRPDGEEHHSWVRLGVEVVCGEACFRLEVLGFRVVECLCGDREKYLVVRDRACDDLEKCEAVDLGLNCVEDPDSFH